MNRTTVVLFVIGFVLIVAGFQGKIGAILGAIVAPDAINTTAAGT